MRDGEPRGSPERASTEVERLAARKQSPSRRTSKRASPKRRAAPTAAPTPCLWFDKNALEAARYYVSVFPRSRVTKVQRSPADYPSGKKGDVLVVDFKLDGRPFRALNGGPHFSFNEAVSFVVDCADQADLDRYYDALSAVPQAEMCGWVKDRFGVAWQLVPRALTRLLASRDAAKAQRVMEAMLDMKRLDVASIEAAGRPPAAREPRRSPDRGEEPPSLEAIPRRGGPVKWEQAVVSRLWRVPGAGGWHFVTLPPEAARELRELFGRGAAWGSIRVEARIGRSSWQTSIFPDKPSGSFVLPVKAQVRAAERLAEGDEVRVSLVVDR